MPTFDDLMRPKGIGQETNVMACAEKLGVDLPDAIITAEKMARSAGDVTNKQMLISVMMLNCYLLWDMEQNKRQREDYT